MSELVSYSSRRRGQVSEQPDTVEPTQTEQAFGLAGEDTAMSMEDYRKQQERKYAGQAEAAFNEYLSKLDPEDAAYQREHLSELPTNSMLDIIADEDRDSIDKYMDPESEPAKQREFVLKYVPRAIAPYVRVVAKGGGFVVVKPLAEIEPVVAEGIAKTIEEHRVRNISEGATASPIEYSTKDKLVERDYHRGAIANILQKIGVADSGREAHRMASKFVGDPTADTMIGGLGLADITGVAGLYGLDESVDEIKSLNKRDDVGAVDYIAPVAVAGLSALELIPIAGGLAKAGKKVFTGARKSITGVPSKTPPKTIDEISVEVDAQIASGEAKKRADKARSKFDLGKAREATEAVEQSKKEAARKVAQTEEGQAIAESALLEYEDTLKKLGIIGEDEKITRKVYGKTVIDYEKAKNIGKSRLDDLDLPDDTVSELGFGADGYRMAVPNPDLLDKFVAVVKTVQDANPDLIGKPTKTKGITRRVYEAAVKDPEILRSKELMDALDEFGLSFEDFVLQVNAGASIAGQVLNRSMQFGRAIKKSRAQVDEEEAMEALNKMGGFGKGMRRFVNVARGALVGTVATAMRNFEGYLVRAPLEGLSNVFENSIHAVATKGAKGLAPNSFKQSYAKTYRGLGEMLRDRKSMEAFTDFILKRDEFDAEYKQMFETVNEIRLGLGRGEATTKVGKGADFILSRMEDYVHLANTPNRMQEFLARRTAFMTRLETLVKREYGVDLVDALNNGRINDLMRGDTSLVGADKRSWNELVGDAVESAMDQTYANGPRNDHLKELLRMFNKIPGGVGGFALPFPRFMLKAAEYMYETTLGLPTAAARRVFGLGEEGGKFVTSQGKITYNAEMASRGMAGWTAIGGFTMAANAGLITDDNKIVLPGGKKLDVTYQFPLGQLVFMGQMFNKALSSEKDFVEWWDGRQARDLFLGVNFRGNTGLGQLMDDAMLLMQNELKAGKGEKTAEAMGQFVADRLLWIAQPYQQVIDLERGLGFRDTVVRDYESDPTMDMAGSFKKGFGERIQQRGFTTQEGGLTAYLGEAMGMGMEEGDRAAPIKQKATKEGGTDRGQAGSLFKFALGLNIMERNTEEQQFFKKYGYNDWDLGSRTGVGTVDNAVNETLSGILPSVAQSLMRVEERFIEQGKSDTFIKKEMKARIKQLTNEVKQKIYNTGIKAKGADDPAYVDALFRLRTFNAEAQSVIMERFYDSQGRYPDLTNTEDIRAMVQIGDRARYKRKLLN